VGTGVTTNFVFALRMQRERRRGGESPRALLTAAAREPILSRIRCTTGRGGAGGVATLEVLVILDAHAV
jgi:hypothetical protein